jgi:nicotinamide-nucleotide amidase
MHLNIVSKIKNVSFIYEKLENLGIRKGEDGLTLFVADCEDVCRASAKEITPLLFIRSSQDKEILYLLDNSSQAVEDLYFFLEKKTRSLPLYFTGVLEANIKKYLEELQLEIPEVTLQLKKIPGGFACNIQYFQKSRAQEAAKKIRKALHLYEFNSAKGSLVDALQALMIEKGQMLVLAESCTGGFLAHQITQSPGCSKYFLGSFVTYSNRLKTSILDVSEEILLKEGAVSSPVVLKMLEGALIKTDADVGIAVSGVAGPEGEKAVGTVWFALGDLKHPEVGCLHLTGSREEIIQEASYRLLASLYRRIRYGLSN